MIGSFIRGSLLIGAIFSISAFSTVEIKKNINKSPVYESINSIDEEAEDLIDVDDEEEEYIAPVLKLSDTDAFISKLTTFGNMSGDINASIEFNNQKVEISGDLFVSLETLDDLAISLSIDVAYSSLAVALDLTYINNTVYISFGKNKNVKLETNKVSDIIEIINSFNIPLELPEAFQNIDTNELLFNLGSMTSNASENQITYTCNLLPGIPPIIFTSDKDYLLTSVAIHDLELEGINISLEGKTKILGKGHNQVEVPEAEENPYVDLSNYFNVINQVGDLIKQKQFGVNFIISSKQNGEDLLTLNGEADIDLNKFNVSLASMAFFNGDSLYVDAKYYDEKIYLNADNSLKVSYSANKINDLIDVLNSNFTLPSVNELLAKLSITELPLLDYINQKDYLQIINHYEGLEILNDGLVIYFNNSLFRAKDSTAKISINLVNNLVNNVQISNLCVGNFSFNITLSLDQYEEIDKPNDNDYTCLNDATGLVSDVVALTKQTKFALNLSGSIQDETGDIRFDGSTQFDISTLSGYGNITFLDKNKQTHKVAIDILEDSTMFFSYNNNLNGTLTLTSIREMIAMLQELASNGNPRVEKYSSVLLPDFTNTTIQKIIDGNYASILKDKIIQEFTYSNNKYTLKIDGKLIGAVNPITIEIIAEDNKLCSLSISMTAFEKIVSLKASIGNWDDNYQHLNVDKMKFYDFSDLSSLTDYLLNTAACNDFTITGKLNIDLNAIGIIKREFELGIDIKVHINEDESVISVISVSNIPLIKLGLIAPLQSDDWDARTFQLYISDNDVNLATCSIKDTTEMTGLFKYTDYRSTNIEVVHLSPEDFINDIVYYFVDFGLGIDKIDLTNKETATNEALDYSKILSNYQFTKQNNIPTWNLGIDLAEVAANNMLGDLSVKLTGDTVNHVLSTLYCTLPVEVYGIVDIDVVLDAKLDCLTPISQETIDQINDFNSSANSYPEKEIKKATTKVKR